MTSFINIDSELWTAIKSEFLSSLSSFDKAVLKLIDLSNCIPETDIFIIFPESLTVSERNFLEDFNDNQFGLLKSMNTPGYSFNLLFDKSYIKYIDELYNPYI